MMYVQKRKEYDNMNKTDYIFEPDIHMSIEEVSHQFIEFISKIN